MPANSLVSFFFFNAPATTEIYTLSLHDALPICPSSSSPEEACARACDRMFGTCTDGAASVERCAAQCDRDFENRKSTRLNSSHSQISYAVFCLKKKKKKKHKR